MLKQFQQATWKVVNLVNSPNKAQKITRNAVASRVIFDQYMAAVKTVDAKQFCAGSLTEMSVRVGGGKFMVNPCGIPFDLLNTESLLFAGIDKLIPNLETGLPKHAGWHQMIYKSTAAEAVLLCQPKNLMAVVNKRQKIPQGILKDADALIAQIIPFSEEKIKEENIKGDDGILMIPSVGILLWGQTLAQLINQVEMLERICAISLLSD